LANLKLQGSTYHARLTIPKDVRSKFGNKSELWRTTGTGDKRKAAIIGAEMVAAWKREVYTARTGLNVREWTKKWAKELRQASVKPADDDLPSDREVVEGIMIDQLEIMVQDRQLTAPEARLHLKSLSVAGSLLPTTKTTISTSTGITILRLSRSTRQQLNGSSAVSLMTNR
jgi:hypothetical protein